MIKKFIVKQFRDRGFEIYKKGVTDRVSIAYRNILATYKIDLILDIGANEGQFGIDMRKLGYYGTMISFEPVLGVYNRLVENSYGDDKWQSYNFAFGMEAGEQFINVSKNTCSSSLLEMLPNHEKEEPDSIYASREKIIVRRLDSFTNSIGHNFKGIMLKIDVQGYEKFVLEGAGFFLEQVTLIQIEMSIIQLYKDAILFSEMLSYMDKLGFTLYNLFPGFNNYETGQLFQVDGIFVRTDLLKLHEKR